MLIKYQRTFHMPWSPGATRDDRVLDSMKPFYGRKVIVTEKMDGENTSIYRDHIHARSLSSGDHPSRTWVKGLWGRVRHNLPEDWRICGENLFAQHSIAYERLSSYFLAFSIWNEENVCLSWEDTLEWCELLEVQTVPVLYEGLFDEGLIKASWQPKKGCQESEGYVVRLADSFPYEAFKESLAKYVRGNHVQTDSHWKHKAVVPNGLKDA